MAAPPRLTTAEPEPQESRVAALIREAEGLTFSDTARAEAAAQEALNLARAGADHAHEALALVVLSSAYFYSSRYPEAGAAAQRALELARQHGHAVAEMRALNGLGVLARVQGEYGRAMESYQEGLRLAQESGDELNQIRMLGNIGVLRMNIGEYDLALAMQTRAAEMAGRAGFELGHAVATVNITVCLYHLGEYARAVALAGEHLPVLRRMNQRQNEAVMHAYVAHALVEKGEPERAAALAREALPMVEALGNQEHLANLRAALGRARHRLGDLAGAEAELRRALASAREHDLRVQERNALGYLGEVSAARGHWQEAYGYSQAHLTLERALHAQESERRAMVVGTQMQLEWHKREAEAQRRRSAELLQVNAALRQAQDHLAYRATHDTLTGLVNRAHFQAETERHLAHLSGSLLGVLFIDLDGFKEVNDTLGHDVGDGLLQEVAARLQRMVRPGDLLARMGGDEFTLLLPNLPDPDEGEQVARRLLEALVPPFRVREHELRVTASVGLALAPLDGRDAITLQKHADVAMYRAKHAGKNAVRRFSDP